MNAEVLLIPLKRLKESRLNPRQHFDEAKLKELAVDVGEHGVLSPILVRPGALPDEWEIIYGHRRFRAATQAGLGFVPAIVNDLSDAEALEAALSENTARESLSPLEIAEGYRRLRDDYGVSADDLAGRLGVSKTSVYNALKLCDLGEPAKELLQEGRLTASTALIAARIKDPAKQEAAAKRIASGGKGGEPLSYREALDILPKDAGVEQKPASDPVDREERAKQKARHKRALAVTDRAVAEMVSKVQVMPTLPRKFLQLLASAIDGENAPETLRRRVGPQADPELADEEGARFLAKVPSLSDATLLGLIFEAVLEYRFHPVEDQPTKALKAAADFFKVDLGAIAKEVKQAEREESA